MSKGIALLRWKERNRERIRAYHAAFRARHRERLLLKWREDTARRRIKDKAKWNARKRAAYYKDLDATRAKVRERNRRHVRELKPFYVRALLRKQSALRASDLPQELVAIKRQQIMLKRLVCQELKKGAKQCQDQKT
jgi:hypothetical protein